MYKADSDPGISKSRYVGYEREPSVQVRAFVRVTCNLTVAWPVRDAIYTQSTFISRYVNRYARFLAM